MFCTWKLLFMYDSRNDGFDNSNVTPGVSEAVIVYVVVVVAAIVSFLRSIYWLGGIHFGIVSDIVFIFILIILVIDVYV